MTEELISLLHMPIPTRDKSGRTNGVVIPIYNIFDRFQKIGVQQVYVTTCDPKTSKGPHLHKKRWGYFTCIRGDMRIVAKFPDGYRVAYSGDTYGFRTIEVPPGIPSRIDNVGKIEAYILNATSPAWRQQDQDDHPVTDWNYSE